MKCGFVERQCASAPRILSALLHFCTAPDHFVAEMRHLTWGERHFRPLSHPLAAVSSVFGSHTAPFRPPTTDLRYLTSDFWYPAAPASTPITRMRGESSIPAPNQSTRPSSAAAWAVSLRPPAESVRIALGRPNLLTRVRWQPRLAPRTPTPLNGFESFGQLPATLERFSLLRSSSG